MNHRTASVDIREKYRLADYEEVEYWPAQKLGGMSESIILSTCNRVELICVCKENRPDLIIEHWADIVKGSLQELTSSIYIQQNEQAITHIFEVAASLDSMILGEPQILGQLKNSYKKAVLFKKSGPILSRLLHQAFSVGKRVRTETQVASNAVSVSYAAVELSKRIFGDLHLHSALLIGAGEMAELAATYLLGGGLKKLRVVNRTFERGQELARKFNCEVIDFKDILTGVVDADIIIASTGSKTPILGLDDVKKVLIKRKQRPLFFIDIAVPRDIDPLVNTLDNVYLYDIDDLKEVVEENMALRQEESLKAKKIIKSESEQFLHWLSLLSTTPTIKEILNKGEQIAKRELAKTLKKFGPISEEQKKALEIMAFSIAHKINHDPVMYLKNKVAQKNFNQIKSLKEERDKNAFICENSFARAQIEHFREIFKLGNNSDENSQTFR